MKKTQYFWAMNRATGFWTITALDTRSGDFEFFGSLHIWDREKFDEFFQLGEEIHLPTVGHAARGKI